MKAILIPQFVPDPSTLLPTEVPKPEPKEDQLLIKVTHCSPQHADILHAQGRHQNNNAKKGWCHPPFVLGYDFAGVVHTAPGGSGFKRGNRVLGAGIGAFAEYVCVPGRSVRRVSGWFEQ